MGTELVRLEEIDDFADELALMYGLPIDDGDIDEGVIGISLYKEDQDQASHAFRFTNREHWSVSFPLEDPKTLETSPTANLLLLRDGEKGLLNDDYDRPATARECALAVLALEHIMDEVSSS